jgi:transposase-like protein
LDTKGSTEATTQRIVSDGAKGLDKALSRHLYGVPPQRCLLHKIKTMADHLQDRSIHVRRDSRSSIAYSEELISARMSATLQSTERHDGIVGQECCHFQLDL